MSAIRQTFGEAERQQLLGRKQTSRVHRTRTRTETAGTAQIPSSELPASTEGY
jgi:hypothetical protein